MEGGQVGERQTSLWLLVSSGFYRNHSKHQPQSAVWAAMSHCCPTWDPRTMRENAPQARWQHVPSGPALSTKAGQGQPDPLPQPHPHQLCFKPCGSFLPLCPSVLVVLLALGTCPSYASPQPQDRIMRFSFQCCSTMPPRFSRGGLRGSEALEWPPPSTPTQPEATKVWCSCHFPYPKSKPESPFAHRHARSPTRQDHTWACSTTLHSHWSLGPTEQYVSQELGSAWT